MTAHMLQKMYRMIHESRVLYWAQIWGIEDWWEIEKVIRGKCYKIVLRIPRDAFYLVFNNVLIIGAYNNIVLR
jgi:hypothetical protein